MYPKCQVVSERLGQKGIASRLLFLVRSSDLQHMMYTIYQ